MAHTNTPWLVIDASGPFQNGNFDLARATLAAGAHYLDLADARRHLLGFAKALDATAQAKGLVALAGAGSTPALSFAAVEALTCGWRRIDSIDVAITPGGASEIGRSVIAAILSYAGKPITVFSAGRLRSCIGWGEIERRDVPRLGRRLVSPVETADSELMSRYFGVRDRVRFVAGLESAIEHLGVFALARTIGRVLPLRRLGGLLHQSRRITRLFCGDRGAMVVEVAGIDGEGSRIRSQWSLLAERGDGLYVPTLAAVAAVRALLDGTLAPGARPCVGVLALHAIEQEMRTFAITTAREIKRPTGGEPFRAALGDDIFDALPPALRTFHDRNAEALWSGRADVDVGRNFIARLGQWWIGLPKAGRECPLDVIVERDGDVETWTRVFSGRSFASRLTGRAGRVEEKFGAISFDLAPSFDGKSVCMPVVGGRFFGLQLPRSLLPKSEAVEYQDEHGRYHFDVKLSLPVLGLLAHYRGWLKPAAGNAAPIIPASPEPP